MRETVLLCNVTDENQLAAIKRLLLLMRMRIRMVKKEEYMQPIGVLAGVLEETAEMPEYEGAELDQPMMIMSGLTGGRMNQLLAAYRKSKIPPIALKAVVTPTNQYWNVLQLYDEIRKEHEAMHS